MKISELRKKFGVSKTPIKATRAFMKELPHFHSKGIDGKAWILLNDSSGTRVSVNTYDGNAGKGFRRQDLPIPPDEVGMSRLTKGYHKVSVKSCPVAEKAPQRKRAKAHA